MAWLVTSTDVDVALNLVSSVHTREVIEVCNIAQHYIVLQGQKLLKKESDVGLGMLLTGKQSTETSCM